MDSIIERYNKDKTRLLDILIDIQFRDGFVSKESIREIAENTGLSHVDVEETLTFYHFLSTESRGKYTIYLNNSVVANMNGRKDVASEFEKETGIRFGSVTPDGMIGLFDTACIGMSDQEPAAIINGNIFTKLNPSKVKTIVSALKAGVPVDQIYVGDYGDGRNNSPYLKSMVCNNIKKKGAVLFSAYEVGNALRKIITQTPLAIIEEVKKSGIKGRGGAGFPTALKWSLCQQEDSDIKYLFCNADEGEPGTFKDRVLLTELPEMLFEGMAIAGYAIGATEGILYIRYEYKYLEKHLSEVLLRMEKENLLGKGITRKDGFDFHIRIQYGAGAYVCGEESALIESAEGKRGEPRDKPPFPAQRGYLQKPTVVNNVETLCSICKIITNGADWFKNIGTDKSTGTKLLSISGDCKDPGVYELPWGLTVKEILQMTGVDEEDIQAVQISGPSGVLISKNDFNRCVSYEDLPTAGSMIIFNTKRDLLKEVVLNFEEFFSDESCGSCVPCRALTVVAINTLNKIIAGNGNKKDLKLMEEWDSVMKVNRCGLGQTALNPIISSLKNFRYLYENLTTVSNEYNSEFNLENETREFKRIIGKG